MENEGNHSNNNKSAKNSLQLGKMFDSILNLLFKNSGLDLPVETKTAFEDTMKMDISSGVEEHKPSEIFRNPLLLYPCIALAIWDALTTGAGTLATLGGANIGSVVAAGLVTCFVSAILFSSFRMLKVDKTTIVGQFMTLLFMIAIFYDFYTSYYGAKFATFTGIGGATDQVGYSLSFSKWLVVLLLTFLSVSATMICSWLYYEESETK